MGCCCCCCKGPRNPGPKKKPSKDKVMVELVEIAHREKHDQMGATSHRATDQYEQNEQGITLQCSGESTHSNQIGSNESAGEDNTRTKVEWRPSKYTSLRIEPNGNGDTLVFRQAGSDKEMYTTCTETVSGKKVVLIRYHTGESGGERDLITSPYHCNCLKNCDTIPCAESIDIAQDHINSISKDLKEMPEICKKLKARPCKCEFTDKKLNGPQFQWDMSSDESAFDISFMNKDEVQMYWAEVCKPDMDMDIGLTNDAANKLNLRKYAMMS